MQQLFDEANDIINGERQDQYGAPENSFGLIARYWAAYLTNKTFRKIDALDVAHMMMLFKIARMQGQSPCRDNYRDCVGYAAIAADRILPMQGKVAAPDEAFPKGLAALNPADSFLSKKRRRAVLQEQQAAHAAEWAKRIKRTVDGINGVLGKEAPGPDED